MKDRITFDLQIRLDFGISQFHPAKLSFQAETCLLISRPQSVSKCLKVDPKIRLKTCKDGETVENVETLETLEIVGTEETLETVDTVETVARL